MLVAELAELAGKARNPGEIFADVLGCAGIALVATVRRAFHEFGTHAPYMPCVAAAGQHRGVL